MKYPALAAVQWLLGSVPSLLAQDPTISRPSFPRDAGPLVLYDTAHWNPPIGQGRYKAVAELLRADGFRVVGGAVPIRSNELEAYKVLILTTPYRADPRADPTGAASPVFTEAECDAIAAWVRAGGNLLLVVGHPPSGAANANLAARFGVNLRNGTVNDSTPSNNWVAGHRGCHGCLKFTRENGLLRKHTITDGRGPGEMVTSVISAVGQSLGPPPNASILLAIGADAFEEMADGDTVSAAGRAQGIALEYGEGRVVILGDGSILSGASYGPENPRFRRWWPKDPDNRNFTLNAARWLVGILK